MAFSALDSALTGPLFATADMAAVFSERATVAAMLRVEAALADGLARAGLAPEGLAAAIAAIDPAGLDTAELGRATALAGVPVIPFVKAVEARLPPDLAPFFHLGATSQDIADTVLSLQMEQALLTLLPDLIATLDGLCGLAERHAQTPCAGRTYGQHAATVTFGYKVAVWASGIAGVATDWQLVFDRVRSLALDGPVGTRSGWGEHADTVTDTACEVLELSGSSVAWHTRRARRAEVAWWLALLLGALGKMATDVVHLASTEVSEVAEPHVAGRGGSSAMPHKHNPIGATVILAAASAAKGHVVTMLDAMSAAHERPAGAWHAEWHALPQLFGLASGALREARALAEGLVVDTARMAANLEMTRGLLYADRAAAALAPRFGRAAAHAVIERAAEAVRSGAVSLGDALASDPGLTGAEAMLAAAFDPAPALAAAAARCAQATQSVRAFTVDFLRNCPT
jgi:3-carboxy-cis,cis-muconate cycloisomerase